MPGNFGATVVEYRDWLITELEQFAQPVDLVGHDLLDHIERDADTRARWVPLLRGTYWHSEPPDVRERVRILLDPRAPPPPPEPKGR